MIRAMAIQTRRIDSIWDCSSKEYEPEGPARSVVEGERAEEWVADVLAELFWWRQQQDSSWFVGASA